MTSILEDLRGDLVVSCQAADGSPLKATEHIVALARAAVMGGAKAVRIEGVSNVTAVRGAVDVPMIGITKIAQPNCEVYITPTPGDVQQLCQAGADIVAFDATKRPRPFSVAALTEEIHQAGKIAMADISTLEEAVEAIAAGADCVGTTLSGYPNMTVAQNIGFPLRMRKLSREEIARKVAEVARLLQIEPLLERRPRELSGGQRQRVAIGRALVRDPKIFLFDEPLSNLDATLRVETRAEIKRLHERIGKTMVYVTHDQIEAMTLATRIVVMNKGDIQQIGTPYEIYHKPANTFVARFVGSPAMQFIHGRLVKDGDAIRFTDGKDWTLSLPFPGLVADATAEVILGVRPEHIKLVSSDQDGHEALVDLVESTGPEDNVTLSVNGQKATARLETGSTKTGQTVKVQIATDKVSLFDATTGKRLN